MLKTIALAISAAFLSGPAQSLRPRAVTMQELTVPAERLPAGCILSPGGAAPLDGNRVLIRSWAGLRIPSNPWTGTDRPVVASIRERMDPTMTPDGPPFSPGEAASFRRKVEDQRQVGRVGAHGQTFEHR